MIGSCETYQAAIMARLDGALGAAEQAALQGHLSQCAACRAHENELTSMEGHLSAIGEAFSSSIGIDLVDSVMDRIPDIADGSRTIEESSLPEHPLMMPYVDNTLDDLTRVRFERQLRANATLRQELEEMRRMDAALRLLAEECRPVLPEITLVSSVCHVVSRDREAAHGQEIKQIEEALWGLGDAIRSSAAAMEAAESAQPETVQPMASVEQGLLALGRQLNQRAPEVDLVDDVMRTVRGRHETTDRRTHRAAWQTRPRGVAFWIRGIGLAAAASVAIFAGIHAARWTDQAHTTPQVAKQDVPAVSPTKGQSGQDDQPPSGQGDALDRIVWPALQQATLDQPTVDAEAGEDSEAAPEHTVSLAEAIEQYRRSQANDQDALARLAEWAQLSPQEARDLLAAGTLTNRQIVSATQYLPTDEAVQVLENLVSEQPDDPYLRMALARAMGDNGSSLEEQLAQVGAWGALDTANGLPSYLEAALQYEMGDYDAALRALLQGRGYEESENYSLESALARADVLEEAGLDRGTAEYLSTLLGGAKEYANISEITAELTELGAYYESVGDYENATEVYQALLRLGDQLGNSATLPSDTMASLDTMQMATQALQDLLSDPDAIVLLSQTVDQLFRMLGNFTAALGEYNALLSGEPEAVSGFVESILMGAWEQMVDQVLP